MNTELDAKLLSKSFDDLSVKVDESSNNVSSLMKIVIMSNKEVADAVNKVSSVLVRQEAQERVVEEHQEQIEKLKQNHQDFKDHVKDSEHNLDKKVDLIIQSAENMTSSLKENRGFILSVIKWGAGIFGTLIISVIVLSLKLTFT